MRHFAGTYMVTSVAPPMQLWMALTTLLLAGTGLGADAGSAQETGVSVTDADLDAQETPNAAAQPQSTSAVYAGAPLLGATLAVAALALTARLLPWAKRR